MWTSRQRGGEERGEETEGGRQHTGAGGEDSAESGSSIYNAVRELRDGENMRRCWHVLQALNIRDEACWFENILKKKTIKIMKIKCGRLEAGGIYCQHVGCKYTVY